MWIREFLILSYRNNVFYKKDEEVRDMIGGGIVSCGGKGVFL